MTEHEAVERAQSIWGKHAIVTELLPSGGAALVSDNVWHQLDTRGHAICHSKCEDLEADVEHQIAATLRDSLRQLVSEALAILDREDPDHDGVDVQDWIRSAKQLLARRPT